MKKKKYSIKHKELTVMIFLMQALDLYFETIKSTIMANALGRRQFHQMPISSIASSQASSLENTLCRRRRSRYSSIWSRAVRAPVADGTLLGDSEIVGATEDVGDTVGA